MDWGVVIIVVSALSTIAFVAYLVMRGRPNSVEPVVPTVAPHAWESKTTTRTYREPTPAAPYPTPAAPYPTPAAPRPTPPSIFYPTPVAPRPIPTNYSSPIRHDGRIYYRDRDGGYVDHQGSPVRDAMVAAAIGAVAGAAVASVFSHTPAQAAQASQPAPTTPPVYGDVPDPFSVPTREHSTETEWNRAPVVPDVDLSSSFDRSPTRDPDIDLSSSRSKPTDDADLSTPTYEPAAVDSDRSTPTYEPAAADSELSSDTSSSDTSSSDTNLSDN